MSTQIEESSYVVAASEHAVENFRLRVKPHLSREAACRELLILLNAPSCRRNVEPPSWFNARPRIHGKSVLCEISNGIIVPVNQAGVAISCIIPALRPSVRRQRRREHRRRSRSRKVPDSIHHPRTSWQSQVLRVHYRAKNASWHLVQRSLTVPQIPA